jgi:F420-dependent oxidoreductase-like protein
LDGRVRIGFYIAADAATPIDAILRRFERAEALGFHTAWVGQIFDHDALSLLALASRATRRIELGTWVVPVQPRHPAALAQQALTVQAASAGRLLLGVGVSHAAVVADRLGLPYAAPARHMREYLSVLRPLLAGAQVEHAGEWLRVSLQLGMPFAKAPPVFLAALGPQMLRLAGELADGVAIWLGGPRYLERYAIPRVREAARAAGRACPRIACGLPVVVARDAARARASAAAFLARSSRLPAYRRVLEREGAAAPADVAVIGDESAVCAELLRLAELGVTDFNAVPISVDDDPDAVVRTQSCLAAFAHELRRQAREEAGGGG